MINDQLLLFSDGQAVSATGASTNKIDLGDNGDDILRQLMLFVHVGSGWTGGGTLTVDLETCDTENGEFAKVETLVSAAKTDATDDNGLLFKGPLPHGLKRWCQLKYTIGNTVTGLKVLAGINLGVPEPDRKPLAK